MTPEQIALVQQGFSKVVAIRDTAARLFYARLFELDPRLERLFRGDMEQQGRKLMAAMAVVIRHLNHLETVLPEIRALGRRHAGYGVEPRHYETVGAALLWTLERGLQEDFTDDARQAWGAAYQALSQTMIEAGAKQAA